MGILGILRSLVRYWWITVPVLLLTATGAVFVALYLPRTYEVTSSYVLLNPPNPPNGSASETNPFLRLADQSSLVALLAAVLNNEQTNELLVSQGANEDYEAAAGSSFGGASLILDVYAPGESPTQALRTAELVGQELDRQLLQLQDAQSVPKASRITLLAINPEPRAELKASSLLRGLIAVVALGGIILVVLVSMAQAIGELRAGRKARELEEAESAASQNGAAVAPQGSVEPTPSRVELHVPESLGG